MAFLSPAKIIDKLNIRPGIKVADFGCGAGHFSAETARRIGKNGTVFAFDVQKEVLSALKSKVAVEHLSNIEIRRADLEVEKGTKLAGNLLDLVFIFNVFFQVEHKDSLAKEAFRVLAPGGRAAVIDWEPSSASLGPPKDLRVDKDAIRDIFLGLGFTFDRELEVGESHYGLIFKKPEEIKK